MKARALIGIFAEKMEQKLQENDGKPGWDSCNKIYLFNRLQQEVLELRDVLEFDLLVDEIVAECADIANFAMMVADVVKYGTKDRGRKL